MIKQEAIDSIAALPDTADWDDVEYALYIMKKVEKGLQDVAAGRTATTEEVRKRLGLA